MSRTVIITGGNRGIGRGLTDAFLRDGWRVVVGARHRLDVDSLGPDVEFVEMDARLETDHMRLVEAATKFGGLRCYINNVGLSDWAPIGGVTEDFFDHMMATNLKSAFWGCKAAAAGLNDGGSIINMSSMAGKRGSSNNSVYCATKFGMNGLTQSLAKELGPKGIRVNAICPVLVRTDGLIEALSEADSPAAGDPEAFLAAFCDSQAALDHLPTVDEVAAYALWLASDAASAMTGQCVNVDCGVFPQ
ncbi:MAG: SDR family NAD(P)-dependent oxidoreductase [Hyphomicrobiales bacterium]